MGFLAANLYLRLRRQLQRDGAGVEFLAQQQRLQSAHLLTVQNEFGCTVPVALRVMAEVFIREGEGGVGDNDGRGRGDIQCNWKRQKYC